MSDPLTSPAEVRTPQFTVYCDKPHESLPYWTARLIGTDSREVSLAACGPNKRAAILAVLDMYVSNT